METSRNVPSVNDNHSRSFALALVKKLVTVSALYFCVR